MHFYGVAYIKIFKRFALDCSRVGSVALHTTAENHGKDPGADCRSFLGRPKRFQGKHHHRNTKTGKHGSGTRAEVAATAGGAKKSPKSKTSGTKAEGECLAGGAEENSSLPPSPPPDWPIR